MMEIISYSKNFRLEWMSFALEERILRQYFGILFKVAPYIFKNKLTILNVKYKIKHLSKLIHYLLIEYTIYRKLGSVKNRKNSW